MTPRVEDQPALVPDPPRPVPNRFYVRRMFTLVVCGVVFTLLGLVLGVGLPTLFYYLGGRAWPTVDRALDRSYESAVAVITDVEIVRHTNYGGRHPWRISFTFETAVGATVKTSGFTMDQSVRNRAIGDEIAVEYDPENPTRARPAGGSVSLFPFWVYALLLATLGPEFVIGLVFLAWVRIQSGREGRLLAYGSGVNAEVIAVRRVWYIRVGWRHPCDVYYRFRDDLGRDVHGRDRTYHYDWAEGLTPGEAIGVVYHPAQPEMNVLWLHGKDASPGTEGQAAL